MTRIVTLHMEFVEGEPPSWRVVETPESTTLAELHSIVYQVFEDLGRGKEYMRSTDHFDPSDPTPLRRVLGPEGNRLDLTFEDGSNPLVIWYEGFATPEDRAAYPRLAFGGKSLLDEEKPHDVSTIEPRELDGAKTGEWTAPERNPSKGIEMVRRFLDANDLAEGSSEVFEKLRETEPEVFAEFEWATNRLTAVYDGVSPRMRQPYHALHEAGIAVEIGLLQQLERPELYRKDDCATGLVADLLAGLKITEAVGPIVELLKLEPETNFRTRQFLGWAAGDLAGPDFSLVFETIEHETPGTQLTVLVALSNMNQENQHLADEIFGLTDRLSDEDMDFALRALAMLHPTCARDNLLSLLDDLIENASAAIERLEEDPMQLPVVMVATDRVLTFSRGIQDEGIELRESQHEPIARMETLFENVAWTGKTGVYRSGKEPGRNDPCPCGSGKKYKKCCIPN